ncbi:MAG: xanthine dehydrogenase family protein molybdopterin-binding subunit [Ahrensia sp.]
MNFMQPKFGAKSAPSTDVKRLEDVAFMTGRGCYTDDVAPDGCLVGYVVRSPVAFAHFKINNVDDVRAMDGVVDVMTADDIPHLGALKGQRMRPNPDGSLSQTRDIPILCATTVRYVGDAIAFITAQDRNSAKDAAEALDIDFDSLDPVVATGDALKPDMPLVWPELGSNRTFDNQIGDSNAVQAAFDGAHHITKIEFIQNRLVANYLDVRAAIGQWDAETGAFDLTVGCQGVFGVRRTLTQYVFGQDTKMRVKCHDVGGGFGPKVFTYREYALVLEAAKRVGAPVKWNCDRTEHFLTDAHGRDNVVTAEMGMDENGRFLALRTHTIAAMGAYTSEYGVSIPWFGLSMATGVYDIPHADILITGVYTNTCPVDAYRGAGRPEAAFLLEKLADQCARDMSLSPAEIRRRNFVKPEQMPYKTVANRVYDVGEFDGHMSEAMKRADWDGFDARLAQSKANGKIRGIGMATYIEACAFAGSEPAFVTLNDDGTVTLDIGTQSNGQGHKTVYAQFAARELGLSPAAVIVRQGDTNWLEKGGGTGGSRSVPLGGASARRAGIALAEKIRAKASDMLEADALDIELADGLATIVGTDQSVSFADIAAAANDEPLRADGEWKQAEATYPNGTHICEVEIDPETGTTDIVRHVIVDDFGATVNAALLEGQVHGGAAQGIGQALLENTVYDESGQLLTASFMDYAMPRADTMPSFEFNTRHVPSTHNELGVKGAGEAGTIGSTPAIMNAVTDALARAYGIQHIDMPATPHRIWQAIQAAQQD